MYSFAFKFAIFVSIKTTGSFSWLFEVKGSRVSVRDKSESVKSLYIA